MEILAPCKNTDTVDAALNSGADALYLGLADFSARKNAENFTEEELIQTVEKAHRQGVKVYVAINTLIYDEERELLKQAVLSVKNAKADAFIVQDMGAVSLMKEFAPQVHLHASTQMTITSVSGAKAAKNLGFKRVVLARELSREQIKEIIGAVDIETEVFVHGALCVCVSGQCYMSAMLGGRSGNRGLCAQPCRLDFSQGDRHSVLSLKDNSIISELRELEKIGVTSAKIEGRMKRPEYVGAAVAACRDALSGKAPDTELLKSVFSRSGFTDGYYRDDFSAMQGIRTKDDVIASPKVFAEIKQLYAKPYKRFALDMNISVKAGEPVSCEFNCDGHAGKVFGAVPEKAVNKPVSAEYAVSQMSKLGGTVFFAGDIRCDADEGLSVSAAELNKLRRETVEAAEIKIKEATEI